MGILRLILALTVVANHSAFGTPSSGVGSNLAVKAFFVISGFYMALVLAERYQGRTREFWANRLLRLFPLHLVVVAMMVVVALVVPGGYGFVVSFVQQHGWSGEPRVWGLYGIIAAMNVGIVGGDLSQLFCLNASTLAFSWVNNDGSCQPQAMPFVAYLINTPMWTVGIELVFYAIAPLLARRSTPALIAITLVAAAPRVWIAQVLNDEGVWSRSFFAFEMVYFLAGMLGYRLYRRLRTRRTEATALGIVVGVVAAVTIYGSTGLGWFYIMLVAVAVPYLFLATKDLRWDSRLGDLSYPVYVVQAVVLFGIYLAGRDYLSLPHAVPSYAISTAIVLVFGVAAERWVTRPIDRNRHRLAATLTSMAMGRSRSPVDGPAAVAQVAPGAHGQAAG